MHTRMHKRSLAAKMLAAWAEATSQEVVALALGKSQSTISRWIAEKGAPPDYDTRAKAWRKRKIPMRAWWLPSRPAQPAGSGARAQAERAGRGGRKRGQGVVGGVEVMP